MSLDVERFKLVHRLDDGRISYRENLRAPPVLVTEGELVELQRLRGKRWLVSYAFAIPAVILIGLWVEEIIPLLVPAIFSVFAYLVCSAVEAAAKRRSAEIIRSAPRYFDGTEQVAPPSVWEVLLGFPSLLLRMGGFRRGVLFFGMMLVTSVGGLIAKVTDRPGFDEADKLSPVVFALLALMAAVALNALFKERHRQK
ncbi:hypothetical protein [Sinorhizobium fredii]|uniref:Uncharacterized protein n=1 Tax=Rhizobium fredii TaxID=380 RepID=A0A2A6M1H9_RHIFR|nr:hypothetical protein [Sinorhizobium fredii]ASY71233.1 hypothetical protein SF83666_c38450 [Sinorhizobium fredii CCBAU 83666]AWI59678.1 hypothetical protein AB395_00004053 [Sinorhizobium fredii CCBAU 45436]PDT48515.1 hypothetical protein CO661_08590 [Sinorhizobium fredii]